MHCDGEPIEGYTDQADAVLTAALESSSAAVSYRVRFQDRKSLKWHSVVGSSVDTTALVRALARNKRVTNVQAEVVAGMEE